MKKGTVGVFGIDPGNTLSGISMWIDGVCRHSTQYSPWDRLSSVLKVPKEEVCTWHVYVEVPQNGTHTSRGGVHWAGGMVVSSLMTYHPIRRRNVHKVTPRVWRKGVFGSSDATKQDAIDFSRDYAPWIKGHDEAEAVAIGAYGHRILLPDVPWISHEAATRVLGFNGTWV